MQHGGAAIETLLAGNRAQAETADILDPTILDQSGDDIKDLRQVPPIGWGRVWNGVEKVPKFRNLLGQASEPFFGADIEIQITARIKARGDLLKTVLYCGGLRLSRNQPVQAACKA